MVMAAPTNFFAELTSERIDLNHITSRVMHPHIGARVLFSGEIRAATSRRTADVPGPRLSASDTSSQLRPSVPLLELQYAGRIESPLDEQLAIFAAHRSPPDNPHVMAHLRMAIYTLAFLDRVPPFAAVSEAVAGVRAAGGERMAGFANAILRRLATEYQTRGRPSLEEAVASSAPGWLRGALRRSLGRGPAAAYLTAGPVPPPIGLCLALGEDRAAWIQTLQAASPGATFEPDPQTSQPAAGGVDPHAL